MTDDGKGPTAKELIDNLQAFMQRCEQMLDQNIEPDLSGLDEQVEALSSMMHELKFDELQAMQPVLQGLMQKLKDLEDQLKAERDRVRESVQSTSQKKQAHTAYQKVQSNPPSNSEEGEA